MPLPIQLGSLTDRLRKLFRIVGRTRFTLDETVVPVVLVQDLTVGPYQAGVIPAAGGIIWDNLLVAGSQVVLLLNPDDVAILGGSLGDQFEGRSWTSLQLEVWNRSTTFLASVQVHITRRDLLPGPAADIHQLVQTQQDLPSDIPTTPPGAHVVPVVMAEFPGGGWVVNADQLLMEANVGAVTSSTDRFKIPPFTLGPTEVVVITSVTGPAANNSMFLNGYGFYKQEPR